MVAVYNKELLSWYLITLKLKERLDAGLPNTSPRSDTSEPPQQQQQQRQLQQPSSPLQVVVNGGIRKPSIGSPHPPEDDWVISINKSLEDACQDDAACSWGKMNIYRVPHCLRDPLGDKAYIPQVVSLGPYHHGRMLLQPMQRHKWRALQHVLKRTNQSIKLYLDSMKELEDRARACYEGPLKLSSNQFAEMMVLDGCFILELFQGVTIPDGFKKLGYARNDPVFSMRGTIHSIQRDMIMLENQIPLFVLDKLFGLQLKKPDLKGQVAHLAIAFFDPLMLTDEPLTARDITKLESSIRHSTMFDPLSDQVGLHCLDVFRKSLLYKGPNQVPRNWFRRWSRGNHVADKRRQQLIHCVTELKDAGIKFRKHKTDRLWDIKFKNGVLYIPRILIHDGTKSLLFNLMAFEQCHLDCNKDITSYVIFLDNLIDSAEDVSYLHYHGIIEHWLGNDGEVANLVNRLCQEVVFDINDSYLSQLSGQVNQYYNRRWNTWRATLRHRYFNNPWAILSVVAAVFLLLMTAAQTFYGVYGYYLPRN